MRKLEAAAVALTLGSVLLLGGCAVVPADGYYYDGYAPYGERYVTPDGLVVVYDYDPGVYTVASYPGLYWWGGYYYRQRGGYWERSHRHNGPWVPRPIEGVPFASRIDRDGRRRLPPRDTDRDRYQPRNVAPQGYWGRTYGQAPSRDWDSGPGANRGGEPSRNEHLAAIRNRPWRTNPAVRGTTVRPGWDGGVKTEPSRERDWSREWRRIQDANQRDDPRRNWDARGGRPPESSEHSLNWLQKRNAGIPAPERRNDSRNLLSRPPTDARNAHSRWERTAARATQPGPTSEANRHQPRDRNQDKRDSRRRDGDPRTDKRWSQTFRPD
jgi:hypothetical protein